MYIPKSFKRVVLGEIRVIFRRVLFVLIAMSLSCSDGTEFGGSTKAKSNNKNINAKGINDSIDDSSNEGPDGSTDESQDGSNIPATKEQLEDLKAQTVAEITSINDFKLLCESSEHQSLNRQLNFPEIKNCDWGKNGNLSENNTYLQARESNSVTLELPPGAIACSMSLKSQEDLFHYDDTLFFSLGKYILISSNDNVIPDFAKEGELVLFDWEKIKGLNRQFDKNQSHCLGSSNCQIPDHDKAGPLNIVLDGDAFNQLGLKLLKETEPTDFRMIATGDNDEEDCFHSNVTMDLTVKYIIPQ